MNVTTSQMQSRVRQEVAMPSRFWHAALLTASIIIGTAVASLLVTEAGLPPRTQWAFAGILLIAMGWSAYAIWVLMRRRVLFGRQRVAASRMALLFTLVAFAGALAVRDRIGMGGIITSAGLVLIATALFVAAQRHVRRLSALAIDMERQK